MDEILSWPWPKLRRWMAYAQLEPFGPVQDDFRAGHLTALTFNANRKKNAKALGPEDFFPSLKAPVESDQRDRRDMSPEEMRNSLLGWVAVLGGEIK